MAGKLSIRQKRDRKYRQKEKIELSRICFWLLCDNGDLHLLSCTVLIRLREALAYP